MDQEEQCCQICKYWDRRHRVLARGSSKEYKAQCLKMDYPLLYAQWDGANCEDFTKIESEA